MSLSGSGKRNVVRAFVFCDDWEPQVIAPLCRKHSCGIEVQSFCYPTYLEKTPDAVGFHLQELADISLITMHGPFHDLNTGTVDNLIREVVRKRYQDTYEAALKLSTAHIILHNSYVPWDGSYNGWLSRTVAFWQQFLVGKTENVNFYLENVLELDPGLLGEVIDQIDNPRVKVCLDVGHAHCHSKVAVADWVKQLGARIGYVHLHNNHGECDEHCGLTDGSIPMLAVLEALELYAPESLWALETSIPTKESSLLWMQEKGFHVGEP